MGRQHQQSFLLTYYTEFYYLRRKCTLNALKVIQLNNTNQTHHFMSQNQMN